MKINVLTSGVVFNAVQEQTGEDSFFVAKWNKGKPKVEKIENKLFWHVWKVHFDNDGKLVFKDEEKTIIDGKFEKMNPFKGERDSFYIGFIWKSKNVVYLFNHDDTIPLRFGR